MQYSFLMLVNCTTFGFIVAKQKVIYYGNSQEAFWLAECIWIYQSRLLENSVYWGLKDQFTQYFKHFFTVTEVKFALIWNHVIVNDVLNLYLEF